MKRKIIKLGQATYVMSLPSKWLRENGLKKGDYLDVESDGNNLSVSTEKRIITKNDSLFIDIKSFNRRTIVVSLHQAYRKGFDELIIEYENKDKLKIIHKVVKDTLLGFEIVKQDDKKCIIQNIAEPSTDKFEVILRKMMLLIKEDSNDILLSLKENSFDIDRRKEVKEIFDNFNNFVRRMIIKEKILGQKDSYLLFYFVSHLSLIQHGYYYFYKTYNREKIKNIDKKTIEILQQINQSYVSLYDSYYKKDLVKAHETRVETDKIIEDILVLIQNSKSYNNKYLLLLFNIARTIAVSTTVLFGLSFNETEKNS